MFRLLNYYGKNYGHEKIVEGRGVHGESQRLPAAPILFLPTGQMPDVMLFGSSGNQKDYALGSFEMSARQKPKPIMTRIRG